MKYTSKKRTASIAKTALLVITALIFSSSTVSFADKPSKSQAPNVVHPESPRAQQAVEHRTIPVAVGNKPIATSSVTWYGKGTYLDGDNRLLEDSKCDLNLENQPNFLEFVLAATKGLSNPEIRVGDSSWVGMSKSNSENSNGVGSYKFTYTSLTEIDLNSLVGNVTVRYDGLASPVLTLGGGCNKKDETPALKITFLGELSNTITTFASLGAASLLSNTSVNICEKNPDFNYPNTLPTNCISFTYGDAPNTTKSLVLSDGNLHELFVTIVPAPSNGMQEVVYFHGSSLTEAQVPTAGYTDVYQGFILYTTSANSYANGDHIWFHSTYISQS